MKVWKAGGRWFGRDDAGVEHTLRAVDMKDARVEAGKLCGSKEKVDVDGGDEEVGEVAVKVMRTVEVKQPEVRKEEKEEKEEKKEEEEGESEPEAGPVRDFGGENDGKMEEEEVGPVELPVTRVKRGKKRAAKPSAGGDEAG